MKRKLFAGPECHKGLVLLLDTYRKYIVVCVRQKKAAAAPQCLHLQNVIISGLAYGILIQKLVFFTSKTSQQFSTQR
jgi:hypothetical protein